MDLKVIEYFDDRTNSAEESLCYLESKIKDHQNLLTKNFCQLFSMYKGNCTALITFQRVDYHILMSNDYKSNEERAAVLNGTFYS